MLYIPKTKKGVPQDEDFIESDPEDIMENKGSEINPDLNEYDDEEMDEDDGTEEPAMPSEDEDFDGED